MQLNDYTHIGRSLDPLTNRNHQLLFVVAAVAGAVYGVGRLVSGGGLWPALTAGLGAGMSTTFAWILARELDPDHPASALLAAGIAGLLGFHFPSLIGLLTLVLAARVANRTTGLSILPGDAVGLFALTVLAVAFAHPVYGFVVALALLLDAFLVDPVPGHRWLAVLATAIGVVGWVFRPATIAVMGWTVWGAAAGLVMVGFLMFIATTLDVRSETDSGGQLYLQRVQAGGVVMLVAGWSLIALGGEARILSLMPLWAAMLAVPLWRLLRVRGSSE